MDLLNREIRSRSEQGRPSYELGPIWLGRRLNSLARPDGWRLIYTKGAYVLHMLRMMLFDFETKSDERFIRMMEDWVAKYSGRIAQTRDFKELVTRHFEKNMDWFFKQWVYGTSLPRYVWNYDLETRTGGTYILNLRVRQEGVPADFRMPVPFMVNFDQGYAVAVLEVSGSELVTREIVLDAKPKSIEPNIWYSVLCELKKGD
jgi:aminopeptidase N